MSGDKQPLNQHMTDDERRREAALQAQIARSSGVAAQKARLDFDEFETSLYLAHPELQLHRSQVRPVSATQTADLLPNAQTVVLQYVVGVSKSFLFTVSRDAAGKALRRVHTLSVSKADLTKRVASFREKLATRDLDFRDDASALYRLLIAPAAADLAGKQTLVIIPDASLWQLPFQVLTDSSNRYLLENYALFFAPSATVLSQNMGKPPIANREAKLLAIGDNEVGRQLARVYGAGNTRLITGMDAAEIAVQSEAPEYTVIHFSAHGFYDDRHPLYSYLQTSQSDDSRLDARQMRSLDLKADVVALSACETGRGGPTGDGLVGMTWALSVAGVPTTVASQWKVDSASTTELMVNFHRALLKPASSKAKALRQAVLAIMAKPEYRHPFYWAGFVMVGDGF